LKSKSRHGLLGVGGSQGGREHRSKLRSCGLLDQPWSSGGGTTSGDRREGCILFRGRRRARMPQWRRHVLAEVSWQRRLQRVKWPHACAGSASARNEEPGGGASLRGEQTIIASETVAAATAVKGTASATNKGNGRIASPRGEEGIQTSSSSSIGQIGASTAPTWCVGLGRK
jgi:hypothetical protein